MGRGFLHTVVLVLAGAHATMAPTPAWAAHEGKSSQPHAQQTEKSKCVTKLTPADVQQLKDLSHKLKDLHATEYSNPKTFQLQVEHLTADLSANAKMALLAMVTQDQMNVLAANLASDPALAKAYLDYEKSIDAANAARKEFSGTSALGHAFKSQKLSEKMYQATNDEAKSRSRLMTIVRSSTALPENLKATLIDAFARQGRADTALDGNAATERAQSIAKTTAGFRATRDISVGAGLMIAGILVGGSTVPTGATVLAASGSQIAALMTTAAMAGTAASSTVGGYRLLRGTVGQLGTSALSDESFFCELAHQQDVGSEKIYADAVSYAWKTGLFGVAIGSGIGLGGVVADITMGAATTMTFAATTLSLVEVKKHIAESYDLYLESEALAEDAEKLTRMGKMAAAEEDIRRSKLVLGRARDVAVEGGLGTIDSFFAGTASKASGKEFFAALKKPPAGFKQVAMALKSGNLEETYKTKESLAKALESQIDTPDKVVDSSHVIGGSD